MTNTVPKAVLDRRLRAIEEDFNARFSAGRHSAEDVRLDETSGPDGPNWMVRAWASGAGDPEGFMRAIERLRAELPLIDPGDF